MAQITTRALGGGLKRFAVVDPTAIESQEVINKTGAPLRLTFVKDVVLGDGYEVIEADDTVKIPVIKAGETYTITAQMIQDALAAGGHTDIYEVQAETKLGATNVVRVQNVI